MRHKRSSPLVGTAHRRRRRAARVLGAVTGYRPGAAVTAVVVTLAVGCGGYLAFGDGSDPPTQAIDPMRPPVSEPTAAPSEAVRTTPSDPRPAPASPTDPSGSAGPVTPSPSEVVEPTRSEDETDDETDAPDPAPTRTASGTPSGDRYEVVPDTTPPRTTLTVEQTAPDSARLTFGADELALFTCTLDGVAFMPCASPRVLAGLEPGWHTFTVTAVDSAGNADLSPAMARWYVRSELEGR